MELFFFFIIVLMLLVIGYAQLQKNVIKMPGKISGEEEEPNLH
ncbi:MAG: hypothetical protein FOGNACKC_02525 [Anaerolineae bacterium]|nr:hypothetical protein [Anaerolineae bacterium]